MSRGDGLDPGAGSASGTRAAELSPQGLGRRQVLQRGLVAAVGVLGLDLSARAAQPVANESRDPRVRRYVPLGRTGLEISDISLGSGSLRDPDLVRHAFDRGINYFDTAESYPIGIGEESENAIGEALQGKRDKVLLASKIVARPGVRKGELMSKLEGSLRRLRTDHLDVYFNHAVNDPARLKNPEWYEFTALAKQQGKIRFTGMSGHGGRLIECLDLALDEDLVDVILTAYNFGQDPAFYERFTKRLDFVAVQPDLPRVLSKAHKQGVGVIAMKTLMGAKLNDMRPFERDGASFAQAAFRWVLANPNVDGLIMSVKSREQIDEYVAASGAASVSRRDLDLLERYVSRNGDSYCRPGCDACESSCPQGVEVSNVLRARMYAVDYGDPERGRASYAGLSTNASACASCRVQSCLGACPYGLKVATLTHSAAALLGQS